MRTWALLIASGLAVLTAGCGGDSSMARSCRTSRDCRDGQICVDGRCRVGTDSGPDGIDSGPPIDFDAGPRRTVTGMCIEPASAELTSIDGARPTQVFRAVFVYSDATEGPALGPRFSIDTRALGDIDEAGGVFVANGVIGGRATITVSAPDPMTGAELTATATVAVRLERTLLAPGAPADAAARFGGAVPIDDPGRAAGVVYPLDGVVMPQNVYPADIQWMNGASGDLFRVTLTKPHVTITAYVAFDGMNHWLVDAPAWRSLAQTDPDERATLSVDRLEAASGQLIRGASLSMNFARAALTGSVYYWDIEAGRIRRIDDGSGTAVAFMPSPPAGADGHRCVGCHSVSNNGRCMAGRLGGGDNIGAVFDLTTDLSGDPAPTIWPIGPSSIRWWFSSWSPDDRRLVVTFNDHDPRSRQLRFYDPYTGTQVPVSGALPSGTHPAWSPDGTRIAYVANQNSWGGAFTSGDIAILSVTGPDAVGPTTIVHRGASIAGSTADSYPTWSPDSMLLAFGNGTGCRSESHSGSIYVMRPDGSGVVRLDRASSPDRDDFQPRFSPFQQGGYYWLSFLSRRIYGNPQIGNSTRPVSRRQQIWVTAIRVGAPPGEDPSAVPYWLPGQSTRSANISAFWAPRPCRPDGEACSVGSECCGGDCRPGADGVLVCSPPPPDRCRRSGETCTTDADCCPDMGLTCIGRVCVEGPG